MMIKSVFLIVLLLIVSFSLSAQEDESFLDDSFLDESFLDESFSEDTENVETTDENVETTDENVETTDENTGADFDADVFSLNQVKEAGTFDINTSAQNRFIYSFQRDSTGLNKDNFHYYSPIHNNLILHNQLKYKNANRWFRFVLDYQLYFELLDREEDEKDTVWDLDTFLGFELKEAYVAFTVLQRYDILLGKNLFSVGSAFLANPSNPLQNTTSSFFSQNRARTVPDYNTADDGFASFEYLRGSREEIGAWMFSTVFDFTILNIQLAYLPQLDTGFIEFDRNDHSFLTKIAYTQWYEFVPSLVFFLDSHIFFGLDVSASVGDEVTLHGEFALSFENELRTIRKQDARADLAPLFPNDEIFHYSLARRDDAMFFDGIVGIRYTPQIENESLFTILFEIYYNGKGLFTDDWNSYLSGLDDLYANASTLETDMRTRASAPSYYGLTGYGQNLYEALRVRPLYLLFQISRDDMFSSFSTEVFNGELGLVYSPFDTTFALQTNFEWKAQSVLSIGTDVQYYFGLDGGAFTELTQFLRLGLYSKIEF